MRAHKLPSNFTAGNFALWVLSNVQLKNVPTSLKSWEFFPWSFPFFFAGSLFWYEKWQGRGGVLKIFTVHQMHSTRGAIATDFPRQVVKAPRRTENRRLWALGAAGWHHTLGKALRHAEASCMSFWGSYQEVEKPRKFALFSQQNFPCNLAGPWSLACLWEHCHLSFYECSVGYVSWLFDFSCRNTDFEN